MTTTDRVRNNRGDAAALMLAGVDDPQSFDTAMRALAPLEAAEMCASAIIIGRDVLSILEDPPRPGVTVREVLQAIVEACREVE